MILRILYGIVLVILILWFCSLFVEKVSEIRDTRDFKKEFDVFIANLMDIITLKEKLVEYDDKFQKLNKRLTCLETDFKTYDELLESRLTDIESVIIDWKDTLASAVTCEHKCAECKSDDSKKSHPKTKPKPNPKTEM